MVVRSYGLVGLCHGLRRTKVGAWIPRMVGVVLAHQGVGHLTNSLLTLHNLMGDAGINDESKNKQKNKNKIHWITQKIYWTKPANPAKRYALTRQVQHVIVDETMAPAHCLAGVRPAVPRKLLAESAALRARDLDLHTVQGIAARTRSNLHRRMGHLAHQLGEGAGMLIATT